MTRINLRNLSALTAMPKNEMKATTGGHGRRGQHDHRGNSHRHYRYCGRFGRRYPWWCLFGNR